MTWTTPPPRRHGEHCPAKNASGEPDSVADRVDAQSRAITASGMRKASVEVLARCAAALMLSLFAYAAIKRWQEEPNRITLLLLVVGAFVTLGLSLFARVPFRRDWTPFAFICAVGGTFYFLAVRLSKQGAVSRDSRRVLTVYRVVVAGYMRGPSAYFSERL
ncbi:hypothetical protein [Paraburkholderia aromaticivorans]|uniref:hypothetical protein n=1 Tax=Paraburkholderia aromaticivorans TaxID=2026199 RepID=UPI001980D84E|nr:hypothetical protein [Paraburkholderia aromaticivorans]